MQEFWEFILLQEPGVHKVVIGTALLSVITALVGTFTILRKRALSSDVISHSILPGICIAFLLYEEKNIFILIDFVVCQEPVSKVVCIVQTDMLCKFIQKLFF